jgi:serine acetyltransferase
MMAGKKNWVKFSNQIYDFELKYLEIYITRSKLISKDILFMNKIYNLYIYNFNKNGKNRGRKDIWCAKSEIIFFKFECVLHEIEGIGQKLFIDFQRHFIHN